MQSIKRLLGRVIKTMRVFWLHWFVPLCVVLFLLYKGGAIRWDSVGLDAQLEERFQAGAEYIDFAADFDFEWDQMFVICPYARQGTVESVIGRDWPHHMKIKADASDAYILVVFLFEGEIAYWRDDWTSAGFRSICSAEGYGRNNARFKVQFEEGPWRKGHVLLNE
ncbi:MAG: hypothetical protein ACI8TQ_002597 [Planctomycetota bacterium]|jgi:hypothetical protein